MARLTERLRGTIGSTVRRTPGAVALRGILIGVWLALVLLAVAWHAPGFWRSPEEHLADARELAEQGRIEEALALMERRLAGHLDDPGVQTFRGYLELRLGEPSRAAAHFRSALEREVGSPQATLGLVTALAQLGDEAGAREVLERAPTEGWGFEPRHRAAQLWDRLAERRRALEELETLLEEGALGSPAERHQVAAEALALAEAEELWPRALAHADRLHGLATSPAERQQAQWHRGLALRALGRHAEALEAFGRAGGAGLEAQAELALQLERFGEATRHLRELVERHPDEPRHTRRLAWALERAGERAAAERLYRDLASAGALDRKSRIRYAWLLNAAKRHGEAWELLEPLPRPAPDAALHRLQARTAFWAGEAAAAPLLSAWVERRPRDADSWLLLAQAWQRRGAERRAAHALRTYLALHPDDTAARLELAGILLRIGSAGEAAALYRQALEERPDDAGLLEALGLALESAGHLEEALPYTRRAAELAEAPSPALYLRLGRLHRWLGRPAEAVPWYRRYLAAPLPEAERRQGTGELALALLETGREEASLAQLEGLLSETPDDPDLLLLAARAATGAARPLQAAAYLDRLAGRRPLSAEEARWRADQRRAGGDLEGALAGLEELLARESLQGEAEPDLLEALGDLRLELGRPAAAAETYESLTTGRRTPRIEIQRARALGAARAVPEALAAYRRAVELGGEDPELRLEAARLAARGQRFEEALEHYDAAIAVRGPAGLRVEVARANLGAGRFAAAEHRAREAIAAGEDPWPARLALAQSLHLQGRPAQAEAILEPLVAERPDDLEGLVWLARASMAQDRHLRAYRLFGRAARAEAQEPERLWLSAGTAALARGDHSRAADALGRAAELGADPVALEAAGRRLDEATAPRLALPLGAFGDSNDLELSGAGLGGEIWAGDAARLWAEVVGGTVRQGDARFDRTVAALSLDHLFPTPSIEITGRLGVEDFRDAERLSVGSLGIHHHREDGSRLGAILERRSFWSGHDRRDPRTFNRVVDLESLGPAARIDEVRGYLQWVQGEERRLRLDLAGNRFGDGNRRAWLYGHYQIPLTTAVGRWTVIRPNLYLESFRDEVPAYFSPEAHGTLGVMFHTIRTSGPWRLEMEANPQWLWSDGDSGIGAHGVLDLQRRIGPAEAGVGLFGFYDDREDYWLWRLAGRITFGWR